jgi:uncharacterized membrane protein YGL010W
LKGRPTPQGRLPPSSSASSSADSTPYRFLYLADLVSLQPIGKGAAWFVVFLGGGWVIQLVGHAVEGRKPALADNVLQIFVAPIFLAAEALFALGYKPALHAAVQKRAREMRAAAGIVERNAAA